MTGSRRGPEGDEDLVVHARRRPLDEGERLDLDAALEADPTLRIAHDVGRAFDDVVLVRPGDEALIARAVDRTLGISNRRAAARPWRTAAAVAAGFLLATGVAAAYRAGISLRPRLTPAAEPQEVAPPTPRTRSRVARAGGASEASTSLPSDPPVAVESAPVAAAPVGQVGAPARLDPGGDPLPARASQVAQAPQVAPVPPVSPPSNDGRSIARPTTRVALSSPRRDTQPPPLELPSVASIGASDGNVTAGDLFRRAGAARRGGALADAAALYRDLQARFPAAEETRVSHVSLGKLLLAMGRPQEAEPHFAIYLAGGAGALAAEAAFGRAQCLERMARPREEREVWLGLLRDHPESVYAAAARKRIAALEATGISPLDGHGDVPAGGPSSDR